VQATMQQTAPIAMATPEPFHTVRRATLPAWLRSVSHHSSST
jgi:hypothetical protein